MEMRGKPFTDTLGEVENGALLRDLSEEVHNIVHAVLETRKAGGLTIKLKFTPTGRGSIEVAATYDANVPEHDRPSTTFFATPDGTLLRNDPNQPRLPLREVETNEDKPLKTVGE